MPMLLHLIFLGALGACAGLFLMRRARGKTWMGLGFGMLFLGLLIHQGWWQIHGANDPQFLHFRDHFDGRKKALRGHLLDRNGKRIEASPATYHLLGYNKKGAITGLEKIYNIRLAGNILPNNADELLQRMPPQDVTLSIDADLQTIAYAALNGQRGAVVALDPRTGEILALVSSPSVSLQALETGTIDKTHSPEFNRATQGLYPPGSVFKIFTAALAIESGQAHPRTCPPKGWRPARGTPPIRDTHANNAQTPLAISTAFAESSNIWFAKAAVDCGWDNFYSAFQRARLDQGLTLAQEGDLSMGTTRGRLPSLKGKSAALAYPGFGQGDLLLTPMHVATLTATIANDGLMHIPHLEKEAPLLQPVRVWKPSTAQNVKALMAASVTQGTSRNISIEGLSICGKTGTAERAGQTSHAWFTCFAPKENPRIVITVLVEHGGYGAVSALPIAKALLQQIFQKY
ncbi:MAG: penicillin-binding transpeptidase domain-containing protein [bacterium]|nr:penicillin-binding transpeptidase domain-containing protein [bacterium]